MQGAQGADRLAVQSELPLLAVIDEVEGEETVSYFTDEQQLEQHVGESSIQDALGLAGAWKELGDWDEVVEELDRIWHASKPTPPIEL